MAKFAESEVEDAALAWLAGLGYAVLHGPRIGPEGSAPERGSYDGVLLTGRLRNALVQFNDVTKILRGSSRTRISLRVSPRPSACGEHIHSIPPTPTAVGSSPRLRARPLPVDQEL